MKLNRTLAVFSILMILFTNCNEAQNKLLNEEKIKSTLSEFYKNYITENSKESININKINDLKKNICSKKLLNKLNSEELDYDPILNAQDCDINWLKTLTIKKDNVNKKMFHVSFIDNYSNTKNKITLIIIEDKGKIKIDEILD